MEEGLISVDKWERPSQAYFLTHLHSDHTRGLSPKWRRGPLYCSPLTAKLLLSTFFPGFDLSLLRILEIGTTVPLTLVSSKTQEQVTVQVTTIDANHCPGAVMYLFQGYFGSFLFTGDFRWESGSQRTEAGKSLLLNSLNGVGLDFLYLDNTYCNPSFAFPFREKAAQQVVDIIAGHPNHEVVIGIDTLGKEDLLLFVARALNTKIWVWPERLQTMHILGFANIFTTDTNLTRVRAIPRYSFSIDTLEALNKVRGPTIGIMPSGLPRGFCNKKKKNASKRFCLDNNQSCGNLTTSQQVHQYVYSVLYSDHSCYGEIQEFIKLIRPSYMRGIVSSSNCNINPFRYFSHLSSNKEHSDRSRSYMNEGVDNISGGTFPGGDESESLIIHRERASQVSCLSMNKRVSHLRRERRGVQIVDMDDI